MATAAAGQLKGPRPGLAIVSFWQGIIEIGLRIASIVLAVLALITAGVALGIISDMDELYRDDIINKDEDDRPDLSFLGDFAGVELPNTPGLVDDTRAACGWTIFLCLAAFPVYQPLVLLLRFLNIGLVNTKSAIFLTIDIVFSFLFLLGFLSGAIALAVWSSQWDDWQGAIDDAKDIGDEDTVDDLVDDEGLHFQTISESLGACAAFSFMAVIVFAALLLWMILFMVFKWNKKLIK